MIENISIMNHYNNNYEYLLKVYTKETIDKLLSKNFYMRWNNTIFLRKRRVEVEYNVISIYLRKGDIIQTYIDYVTKSLRQVKNDLKLIQDKMSTKKKRVKLKRNIPAKSYSAIKKSIT